MPSQHFVIGLDSSTTACKAIVVDARGHVVASGQASLPMLKPRSSWHEQPADSWWEAACQALRAAGAQVDSRALAALCIAAQRETFVVTDEDGHPLANALLWMDERCRGLLAEIDDQYGRERIHQETGKPLSANLSLGKLYWLRATEVVDSIWQVAGDGQGFPTQGQNAASGRLGSKRAAAKSSESCPQSVWHWAAESQPIQRGRRFGE